MIKIYLPQKEDLWFRKLFLGDEETMSYNQAYGGTIDFTEDRWDDWYKYWILDNEGERYYRYLINESNDFVGEIAYHYDGAHYIASIIIYSKYRHNGYGKEGLKLLCQVAKENGINKIYDDIGIDNSAIRLFIDFGFREVYKTDEIIMLEKEL